MSDQNKSRNKAAGVKSIFIDNDTTIFTSFGKGPKANIEKKIKDNKIIAINNPGEFDIEEGDFVYYVKGKNKINSEPTRIDKNAESKTKIKYIKREKYKEMYQISKKEVGVDQIRIKAKLEKLFFNKTYNDNIKIQIAYNILDIKKIMIPHVNNIIYSLTNLTRNNKKYKDFIGEIKVFKKEKKDGYEDFYNRIKDHMCYYPLILTKKNKGKFISKNKDETYDVLRMLGAVRQFLFHGDSINLFNKEVYNSIPNSFIDEMYNDKIKEINKSFIEQNIKFNFKTFKQIYKKRDFSDIVREYYNFAILSEGRNVGVSIKKLRENMLEFTNAVEMNDCKYDKVRRKIYLFMDFAIFLEIKDNADVLEEMIYLLRATEKKEDKEDIYRKNAEFFWAKIENTILNSLVNELNEEAIKKAQKKEMNKEDIERINDVIVSNENICFFSKIVFFLNFFLEPKEINDLTSNLINKFENIASLINVNNVIHNNFKEDSIDDFFGMLNNKFKIESKDKIEVMERLEFAKGFELFDNSKDIANQLRFIKGISKKGFVLKETERLFIDAAQILGVEVQEGARKSDIIEKTYNIIVKKDLRNFMLNNVINSKKFLYLIRHADPQKIRSLAKNKIIIEYVLKTIEDKQISRYYKLISDNVDLSKEMQIKEITDAISHIHFDDYRNVRTDVKEETPAYFDREKKKRIIGLYLTVLYLAYKNLIYVNSRYVTAFYCFERDNKMFFPEQKQKDLYFNLKKQKRLVNYFIENRFISYKYKLILESNLKPLDNFKYFKEYRNKIVHLNILNNLDLYIDGIKKVTSYFALFHYMNQKGLCSNSNIDDIPPKLREIDKYGSYSKDFLHMINAPFGYNIPRYKNLSIECLFDRDREKVKE